MTVARRTLITTASPARSRSRSARPALRSRREPFPEMGRDFRAKARAKGISDATYTA
jgi:hypothetical protein